MRRADRLFQLIQCLRGGRLMTARDLGRQLEVSERTIYRDIADLAASGVPIRGEAGIGYVMAGGYDVPPLMFTRAEIEALTLGARMVQAWGGTEVAKAAIEALIKIAAVMPETLRDGAERFRAYAPDLGTDPRGRDTLDILHHAIGERRVISFDYTSLNECRSTRSCRPLGLYYWGKVWTLVGWCELRQDFREFRTDRINALSVNDRSFREERGRSLQDYLKTTCDG